MYNLEPQEDDRDHVWTLDMYNERIGEIEADIKKAEEEISLLKTSIEAWVEVKNILERERDSEYPNTK